MWLELVQLQEKVRNGTYPRAKTRTYIQQWETRLTAATSAQMISGIITAVVVYGRASGIGFVGSI